MRWAAKRAEMRRWRNDRDNLNSRRRALIVAAYRDQMTVALIARELGVGRQRVYDDLHAAGAIDSSRCPCVACKRLRGWELGEIRAQSEWPA